MMSKSPRPARATPPLTGASSNRNPTPGQSLFDPANGLGSDGAHNHNGRPRRQDLSHAIFSEQELLHLLRVHDHQYERFCPLGSLSRRVRLPGPQLD